MHLHVPLWDDDSKQVQKDTDAEALHGTCGILAHTEWAILLATNVPTDRASPVALNHSSIHLCQRRWTRAPAARSVALVLVTSGQNGVVEASLLKVLRLRPVILVQVQQDRHHGHNGSSWNLEASKLIILQGLVRHQEGRAGRMKPELLGNELWKQAQILPERRQDVRLLRKSQDHPIRSIGQRLLAQKEAGHKVVEELHFTLSCTEVFGSMISHMLD
mmetsp:Transcript_54954/g.67353  ORF Transcript_54954/g.67353 Transcript_54954/m.67353 type:complete len:218 (+) Transcript_54954:499-1152(+)